MKNFIHVCAALVLIGAAACGERPAAPEAAHGGAGHDEAAHEEAAHEAKSHDESEEQHEAGLVEVSPEAQRAGGIKTATLRRASVPETFQAMGRVLQDAQKAHQLTAAAAGEVAAVAAALGQAVNQGDPVAVIRTRAGETLTARAPHKGIVTALHAGEGDQVSEMSFLATITDVDPLWGVLDIPERSLESVRAGQQVEIRTAAYPKSVFAASIVSVSPEIDALSRTVKARVSIANPGGRLKFGMFIDAAVRTGAYFQGVAVRADAVQNGPAGPFVFVKKGEDGFLPAPVETGREKDGLVEIKKGLAPGDKVVVEGAFLLKSEMMKAQMGEGEHAH
ncbi:MAG: hypothetical protein A2X32_05545 [Elusimicrobia bacterium GWC2_64_44]|nr:MAG: hypothetical protein A2X32_05545 [Elusimicrobia bacterium GWC2_64_44]